MKLRVLSNLIHCKLRDCGNSRCPLIADFNKLVDNNEDSKPAGSMQEQLSDHLTAGGVVHVLDLNRFIDYNTP